MTDLNFQPVKHLPRCNIWVEGRLRKTKTPIHPCAHEQIWWRVSFEKSGQKYVVSSMTRMTRPKLDLARSQNESVTVAKDLNVAETSARATIVPAPVFAPLPLVATAAAAAPAPPSPVEAKLFVFDPVAGATARKESTAAVESAKREIGLEKQSAGQIAGVSGAARCEAMRCRCQKSGSNRRHQTVQLYRLHPPRGQLRRCQPLLVRWRIKPPSLPTGG